MINVLGSFAEFEREMITDRTRRWKRYKVEVRGHALDMQVSERTVQLWLSLPRRHAYIRARTTGRALAIWIEKWRPVVKGARRG